MNQGDTLAMQWTQKDVSAASTIDAAHTVKRHWAGILRWCHSKIANGLIEDISSLVQTAGWNWAK